MSSSKRHSLRPVIVEVRPDNVYCNIAPSTPPSPKAVRFAPILESGSSRPLSSTEAWSLYHFESHARQCAQCYAPYEVYRRGDSLCNAGLGLAQDVTYHVYARDGEVYSMPKEESKLVRVEIPRGYTQLRSLLKALDRGIRSRRTAPTLSYDRTYPVSSRRPYSPQDEREQLYIQPAMSAPRRSRPAIHRRLSYSGVVVDDGHNAEEPSPAKEQIPSPLVRDRRGSLYDTDMQRRKSDYRVEVREPSGARERRRKSGVWM